MLGYIRLRLKLNLQFMLGFDLMVVLSLRLEFELALILGLGIEFMLSLVVRLLLGGGLSNA